MFTVIAMRRRALLLLLVLSGYGVLLPGCVDRPLITFANFRDEKVAIHIDGDRVLILPPRESEGLPYAVASWTWRRRIEARDSLNHVIWISYLDAGDLVNQHWRLEIH